MFGRQFFQKHGQSPQQVLNGRFELERDGKTAYLEYNLAGNILQLVHTEVPAELRGLGLASELAKSALDWARENNAKVDVICTSVAAYMAKHPEYNDLLIR
jgi:predicted GNAT family acetyltransferase